MINNRLIHIMGKSRKYVSAQVLFQWISLLCNIVLMSGIALFLSQLSAGGNPEVWKKMIWILLSACLLYTSMADLADAQDFGAVTSVENYRSISGARDL